MATMKSYKPWTWLIIGVWFLFGVATLNYNGPFFDEGIYLTAGQRTLEGHGYSDGYLGWFAGSLLWPVLAGIGTRLGGLLGARTIALIMAAAGFAAFAQAVRNLFAEQAGFWATLAFALNAPFLALARMGVYDSTALAGIAVSFWAITELKRRDHRIWLAVAAVSFTLAVFAKYPIALMLFPIAGVLLVLRREKAVTDIVLFGFLSAAVALAFFLPVRDQVASFLSYRLTTSPISGVTPSMIAVDLLRLSAVPFLLAVSGWLVARDRRGLASVLLLSMVMWPAYHLVLSDSVSRSKHLVFGFLFAYPLVGLALSALWGSVKRGAAIRKLAVVALVLALAVTGFVQLDRFNRAWPDARPTADYLLARVEPGQKLLINESWPYTMYLYTAGRIDSPWDVFDVYRITRGESEIDLCEYDWFVDSYGSYKWPESILETIRRCGVFQPVFSSTSAVVGMGTDLDYVAYQVPVTVWQNTATR
jgi:4-amino-4-deoxy-L-arabinose transferase-like glycosyltransferase